MNPRYPIYIVSKGRWESRLTSRTLEELKVPYFIIIEQQEYDQYAAVIDPKKILILPKEKYHSEYEVYDNLGLTKSPGPGPARNFAWDHSIEQGYDWHWVMDDNIQYFFRYNKNLKVPVSDGTIFRCMEDFVERYSNIGMAGPNYFMFCSRKSVQPPFVLNTRIYSCNLIRNNLPYRWRGRYNEDTDLSLRILKGGLCTVQFQAFLQGKVRTQVLKGGNTKEFYAKEGTLPKSEMLVRMHPDVAELVWKFRRWHHYVDYKPFRKNKLIRKADLSQFQETDNYGMELKRIK